MSEITTTIPTAAESRAITGFTYFAKKHAVPLPCEPAGQQTLSSNVPFIWPLVHDAAAKFLAGDGMAVAAWAPTINVATATATRILTFLIICIIFAYYTVFYLGKQQKSMRDIDIFSTFWYSTGQDKYISSKFLPYKQER